MEATRNGTEPAQMCVCVYWFFDMYSNEDILKHGTCSTATYICKVGISVFYLNFLVYYHFCAL